MQFYFGTEKHEGMSRFYYVNNPDGTLRWVIPADAESASFLALYNSESLKAWLYKLFAKAIFSTGLKRLMMSGSFLVKPNLITYVKAKYGIKENEQFTLFTGTRGANRKLIIEINNGTQTTHFIKICFSESAQKNLQNEIVFV